MPFLIKSRKQMKEAVIHELYWSFSDFYWLLYCNTLGFCWWVVMSVLVIIDQLACRWFIFLSVSFCLRVVCRSVVCRSVVCHQLSCNELYYCRSSSSVTVERQPKKGKIKSQTRIKEKWNEIAKFSCYDILIHLGTDQINRK